MNNVEIQNRFINVLKSKTFKRIVDKYALDEKRVLDLGCGYGAYMQRFGKGSAGITTTRAEVEYGTKNNIDIRYGNVEHLSEIIKNTERFDVFWANNLFEHLLSPHTFLVHLKQFAKENSFLILGVPVIPKIESLAFLPKFRGSLASPHINFFTKKTLETTVLRAGWKIHDIRSFHLPIDFLDRLATSLVPHLYVIAENDTKYSYPPKKITEWENDPRCVKLINTMNSRRHTND